MSTKNIVFNIRTDEDTVNKFKSLSDKPNTTQGEFLKKLVEEYEKNLGFKEGIDVVEVAPKNQDFYHLFINSNHLIPGESAKIIHSGTHQRYQRL